MAPRYVPADTPLERVRVFVDGLTGETRACALRAAQRLNERSLTLGKLDAELNAIADELGDGAAIDVTPGPKEGMVSVTLRTEHGSHIAARAGQEAMLSGSAVSLKLDSTPAAARGPPPLRVSAEGAVNLGQDGLSCCMSVAPLIGSGSWGVLPSLQGGFGFGGLLGLIRPESHRSYLQLCLADRLGRHKVRLGASSRDLRTQDSPIMQFPLQSSKTSISYQFLKSYGADSTGGQLGLLGEISGLLGDVKVGRAEAAWSQHGDFLGCTWQVSASAAGAVPLHGATIPWEERLFLGGAMGQGPAERLLGFRPHGLGPAEHHQRDTEGERFGLVNGLGGFGTYRTSERVSVDTGKTTFIGGDTRVNIEGLLRWPVPLAFGFHAFAFGTAGLLVERKQISKAEDILRSTRAALGIGLGIPLPGGGHIAATFSQPIQAMKGDLVQTLQLSLSFDNFD